MSNLMYEEEDFSYCEGCVHACTGKCDTCNEGSNRQE